MATSKGPLIFLESINFTAKHVKTMSNSFAFMFSPFRPYSSIMPVGSLLFVFTFLPHSFAFDAASNEMPLDPNNGIKSAFTNQPPIPIRVMPHQPSESEKMPYEYWSQNRPFAHVHGTEPEHPELRHQHFGLNYYENFDNFITDPPGTGLNVRSIDDQFNGATKTPHHIVQQQIPLPNLLPPSSPNLEQNFGQEDPRPLSGPSLTPKRVLPIPSQQQLNVPKATSELGIVPLAISGSSSQIGGGGSPLSLSARFPNSFKPNLAKLINEVDPNSSEAATNDEEETLGERAINNGAFNGQKPPSNREFDAYEDLPDFKAILMPRKPSSPLIVSNKKPANVAAIRPPKLLPFIANNNNRRGKLTIRKKLGRIVVSREQQLPDNLPAKIEGHPSAIVVEGTAGPVGRGKTGGSYAQQQKSQTPAAYKGSIRPYEQQPPSGYKTGNQFGQNYPNGGQQYAIPAGKSNGCHCPSPPCSSSPCSASNQNCCGDCCRPSQKCCNCCGDGPSNCAPTSSCCCGGGGNSNGCCCRGGGDQSPCRIRLLISCQPEPCKKRRFRTAQTRLLFAHRRRRRLVNLGEQKQNQNDSERIDGNLRIWGRR